jgi:hypothetical protein
VECLFSISPSYRRAEYMEEEGIQRRPRACSEYHPAMTSPAVSACTSPQGLTLVHFSASREHFYSPLFHFPA